MISSGASRSTPRLSEAQLLERQRSFDNERRAQALLRQQVTTAPARLAIARIAAAKR